MSFIDETIDGVVRWFDGVVRAVFGRSSGGYEVGVIGDPAYEAWVTGNGGGAGGFTGGQEWVVDGAFVTANPDYWYGPDPWAAPAVDLCSMTYDGFLGYEFTDPWAGSGYHSAIAGDLERLGVPSSWEAQQAWEHMEATGDWEPWDRLIFGDDYDEFASGRWRSPIADDLERLGIPSAWEAQQAWEHMEATGDWTGFDRAIFGDRYPAFASGDLTAEDIARQTLWLDHQIDVMNVMYGDDWAASFGLMG